jgi:hypothetical protein
MHGPSDGEVAMSEVDRLSNSGLYPALPMDEQRRKDDAPQQRQRGGSTKNADPRTIGSPAGGARPPKSLIDEYA